MRAALKAVGPIIGALQVGRRQSGMALLASGMQPMDLLPIVNAALQQVPLVFNKDMVAARSTVHQFEQIRTGVKKPTSTGVTRALVG